MHFDRPALGSFLINVGRGSIVDERAIAERLESGHLAGYAADVFEMEDSSRAERPASVCAALIDQRTNTLFTTHLSARLSEGHGVRLNCAPPGTSSKCSPDGARPMRSTSQRFGRSEIGHSRLRIPKGALPGRRSPQPVATNADIGWKKQTVRGGAKCAARVFYLQAAGVRSPVR